MSNYPSYASYFLRSFSGVSTANFRVPPQSSGTKHHRASSYYRCHRHTAAAPPHRKIPSTASRSLSRTSHHRSASRALKQQGPCSSTITKTKNPARIRTKSSKCRSSRRHQLKRGRGSRRRLKTSSCHHVLKGRFDSILCHCTVFQLNYFRDSVRQSESPHRTQATNWCGQNMV